MSHFDGPGRGAAGIARVASAGAIALGCLGLLGYLLDITFLQSLHPGWVAIRPLTALGLLLLAVSAWPLRPGAPRSLRRLQPFAALVASALGGVALGEYLSGVDLGVDRLLFPGRLAGIAARMAPSTAVAFVLLGVSRAVREIEAARVGGAAKWPALLAGLLAALVLLAYGFGATPYEVSAGTPPMAVLTALGVVLASVALIAGDPRSGLVRALGGDRPGSQLARRQLTWLVVALILLNWAEVIGERHALFSDSFGDALQTIVGIALLGGIVLWSASQLDRGIAEQHRTEARLERSQADYRTLVDDMPVGLYRSSVDGRFLSVNPALVRMLGYASEEEVRALDIARDVYADPRARREVTARVEAGESQTEVVWKRKDGSLVTVRLTGHPVRSAGGRVEYYQALAEDVTQQRSLEAQVRQAQRLEAVGRLAGGVAHDFNNMLTVITGYTDLLMEALAAGDPKREDVQEIRAATQRAATLTRQLLAFSRRQVQQLQVLDLNSVVRGLDKMLQRLIGEDVKLELVLGRGLGAVRADAGQVEQVIMNLVVNARDAMPRGGRLTIETADVALDASYAGRHPGVSPGPHVMLAVTDTGMGMNAETLAHLFEPFFTTKEPGKGTGLGLATVYGIVKQSGGSVWAYSEPGRGSTFKVYLPRVFEPVRQPETAAAPAQAKGGSETVLVAEDDPGVREVVADTLGKKGYLVLRAPDGQTALELAGAHQGVIHLLVTDLVMPGMTGRELADALAEARPGVRVLYMSGYTDDAVVRQRVLDAGMPYLQKPFGPSALVSKVRSVLDAAATAPAEGAPSRG